MPEFAKQSVIASSANDLFAWHARPGALQRLLPPWQKIQVLESRGGIEDGARTVLSLRKGPFRFRWVAVHRDYQEGLEFTDDQLRGPFAEWRHTHRVRPLSDSSSQLEDDIRYRLPFSPVGGWLAGAAVRRDLQRTFDFRHKRTADDLARHAAARLTRPLRIIISGASGLIGTNLTAFLSAAGHEVRRLVRRSPREEGEIAWNPASGIIDSSGLEGADAFIHPSGRNLAALRWTAAVKREIRRSRIDSTRLVAETLAGLSRPPRTLIAASAIGYYGGRGDEIMDEQKPPGQGFLAELCRDWEEASQPAREAGLRVVNLRTGLVVTASGGFLGKMLLPFYAGFGGPLGDGQQYMSWIALDDLLGAILQLLANDGISGPVNAVAPNAVRNIEFTQTLGSILKRPTFARVPSIVLRGLFGEMGEALFLDSTRVEPSRLTESGFRFLYPRLEAALRAELGRLA